ncbi:MAG: iron-sulfur cluster assembly scaffold protein [Pseudomonadota bacterium]
MTIDLYQDAIRALAQSGRTDSRLAAPDRSVTLDNPLCGDRVTIDLHLDGDRVMAVGHEVRGCLLCEASAALAADAAPGRDVAEFAGISKRIKAYLADRADTAPPLTGMEVFAPARAFRSRHRCVTLAFEALERALREPS